MSTHSRLLLLTLAAAFAVLGCRPEPARAQDPPPAPAPEARKQEPKQEPKEARKEEPKQEPTEEPKPESKEEPPAPVADPTDLARLGDRMISLIGSVRSRPDSSGIATAADREKARGEFIKADNAWRSDVDALNSAADRYAKAIGEGAEGSPTADARALFAAGLGKSIFANLQSVDVALRARMAGAKLLERCLALAPADADFRADAESTLATLCVFLTTSGNATLERVFEHASAGVNLLRKEGRPDDAGQLLALCLASLTTSKRVDLALKLAEATEAETAAFGPSTETIRTLVAAAKTGVGTAFPEMPAVKDSDGLDVNWAAFAGKPFIVHFFNAGWANGYPSEQRDVDTVLRPLYDALSDKGLAMLGVSMDFEMPATQVEQVRKNWDEWSIKKALQDGKVETVRKYTDAQGVVWPWVHSGTWLHDPISKALGGCGRNAAHAVLVDGKGVIRWRGNAPFDGLPEAARALLGAGDEKSGDEK